MSLLLILSPIHLIIYGANSTLTCHSHFDKLTVKSAPISSLAWLVNLKDNNASVHHLTVAGEEEYPYDVPAINLLLVEKAMGSSNEPTPQC